MISITYTKHRKNNSSTLFQVRGFDPTVTSPNEDFSWPRNFIFQRVGISNETKEESIEEDMYKCETLDNLMIR